MYTDQIRHVHTKSFSSCVRLSNVLGEYPMAVWGVRHLQNLKKTRSQIEIHVRLPAGHVELDRRPHYGSRTVRYCI